MHGDKDEMKAKEFMKASKVLATNGSHDLFVRVACGLPANVCATKTFATFTHAQ